jgi:mannosyltransferase
MKKYSTKLLAKSNAEQWLCALFIVFACIVVLLWWSSRKALWEDEVIAITHANQSLPLFFMETLRNDIHPPLYFLQLKFWHDIGLNSDAAVLFNSVVCAFISLAVLFGIARKVYGIKAACYATALYALLPIFAYSGGNLRMYGLVPACVLLVWYANRQWFLRREGKWLAGLVLIEVATSYVHAIEFFFVGFIALAAFAECLYQARQAATANSTKPNAGLGTWILAQGVVLILIVPLMGSAVIRGSDSSAPATVLMSLTEPGALIAGWAPASIMSLRLAGLLIFLFLAAAAMLERRSRIRTLVVPIAALAVAIAVSMLAKPMIKVPVFASNLLPFLALGAGAGIAIHGNRYWRVGAFICMTVLAVGALPLMRYQMTTDAFAVAAKQIRQLAQPGDVVVVPKVSIYWGVMRYAVGENWGKPLDVMPSANAQWESVFRKLGPEKTALLGLVPSSDHVVSHGVTYVVGEDARHLTANANRVWVLHRDGYNLDVQFGAPFVRKSIVRPADHDLALSLFVSDANGGMVAKHPIAANDR